MKRAQVIAIVAALVTALVLAFALQDVIRETVIIPMAYLWWVLGLYYHSLPQIIIWVVLIVIVVFMLLGSLSTEYMRKGSVKSDTRPLQGPIESLAVSIEKARGGIYIKWQIAHRLGNLARDLLIQRGDRANVKDVGPLTGRDWHPSHPVDEYLEVGLNGSFADYPNPSWPFRRPQRTPLDLDINEATEFLEAQMETYDGR
jgi:uncharacterized membrane protein